MKDLQQQVVPGAAPFRAKRHKPESGRRCRVTRRRRMASTSWRMGPLKEGVRWKTNQRGQGSQGA
jgi:hypothetical protein